MAKPNDQREVYEKLKLKTEHPFLKRYVQMGIKEGFFSDMTGALGRMHDTLVQAAYPELIGRNIITVMPTSEPMERFPLDTDAVAYRYAEGESTSTPASWLMLLRSGRGSFSKTPHGTSWTIWCRRLAEP